MNAPLCRENGDVNSIDIHNVPKPASCNRLKAFTKALAKGIERGVCLFLGSEWHSFLQRVTSGSYQVIPPTPAVLEAAELLY